MEKCAFIYTVLLQVFSVLMELFLFIVIIVYVFLGIGLELFAIASSGADNNYFQEYGCELVSCSFLGFLI